MLVFGFWLVVVKGEEGGGGGPLSTWERKDVRKGAQRGSCGNGPGQLGGACGSCLNRGEGRAEGSAEGQGEQGGTEVRLSVEFQQTGSSEVFFVVVFGLLCVFVRLIVCLRRG